MGPPPPAGGGRQRRRATVACLLFSYLATLLALIVSPLHNYLYTLNN